ncbi:ATP-binding cassette sub- G member 1 [Irineochytrium annulatum]|nr:ATP-binding cassette sub- G member 1 [Irineochytrium annulatum]
MADLIASSSRPEKAETNDVKIKVPLTAEEDMIMRENMLDEKDRMEVVFRNLDYTIRVRGAAPPPVEGGKQSKKRPMVDKHILKGVTGVFRPGRLTAVMGASGAGKTSLLQIVAAEARLGALKGQIQINGEDARAGNIKKISGFVFQDEYVAQKSIQILIFLFSVILDTMTVKEAVTMSALLRLPSEMPLTEKTEKVDKMIQLLNLEKAAGTIIGNSSKKGISGGERKRTAMAMEMITNPSLFKHVNHGFSHLFDDLVLMADGRIIYTGEADKAIDYFDKHDYHCPDFTNPADFLFMSVLNNEDASTAPQTPVAKPQQERINGLLDAWDASAERQQLDASLATPRSGGITAKALKVSSTFPVQFAYLFNRASKNAFRNPLVVKAKLGQSIAIALIIGVLYQGTGTNLGYDGSMNRSGLLFFTAVNMVMSSTIGVLSIFGEEKIVFAREFGAGYYGLPSYFISKIMVEMPFQILFPWIFATIVFTELSDKGIKYISPMKYAYEGLYKNEFTGLDIVCTINGTARVDGSVCITGNGMDDNFSIGVCAIVMVAMTFGLIGLAFLSLVRLVMAKGKAVEPQKA